MYVTLPVEIVKSYVIWWRYLFLWDPIRGARRKLCKYKRSNQNKERIRSL